MMEESKIIQMFREQEQRIIALEDEIKNLDRLLSTKDDILPCPGDCDTCPVVESCTRTVPVGG